MVAGVSCIDVYAPLQGSYGFLPASKWPDFMPSLIWTATTDKGSRVVTWEGARQERDVSRPLSFQAEFHENGEVTYRYNPAQTNFASIGLFRNGTALTFGLSDLQDLQDLDGLITNYLPLTTLRLSYIGDLSDGSDDRAEITVPTQKDYGAVAVRANGIAAAPSWMHYAVAGESHHFESAIEGASPTVTGEWHWWSEEPGIQILSPTSQETDIVWNWEAGGYHDTWATADVMVSCRLGHWAATNTVTLHCGTNDTPHLSFGLNVPRAFFATNGADVVVSFHSDIPTNGTISVADTSLASVLEEGPPWNWTLGDGTRDFCVTNRIRASAPSLMPEDIELTATLTLEAYCATSKYSRLSSVEEFGFSTHSLDSSPLTGAIAAVSNHWSDIIADWDFYLTNGTARMLLENVVCHAGTNAYLNIWSGLLEICTTNGDIPRSEGVCSDVVVRALRDARNMDLQELMHGDMEANFNKYPRKRKWLLARPDSNIDHRRVLNQECFFTRQGWAVPVSTNRNEYLPGDFVTCRVYGLPHIMIVSDRKTRDGTPLVIHNIGGGTQEENALFGFQLTGHFRLPTLNRDSVP